MATLNVKAFPDSLYRKLQARAKKERRSLAQEITHLLAQAVEIQKPLSILELRGLGNITRDQLRAAAQAAGGDGRDNS